MTKQVLLFLSAVFVASIILTAQTVQGAIYSGDAPYPYGTIVMSVEEHFALSDSDQSGAISLDEYVVISDSLKSQPADSAAADFEAMDTDGDGMLSYNEFYGELPSELTV